VNKILFKAQTAWEAIRALGPVPVTQNAAYLFALHSGWLRRRTQQRLRRARQLNPGPISTNLLPLPNQEDLRTSLSLEAQKHLLAQADEICAGRCRFFFDQYMPILPNDPVVKTDWTACSISDSARDVKVIWEPGRFGWVFTLGMAYLLTRDEKYPLAFWDISDHFYEQNPAYCGWQWVSGQETALRLVALVYASQVFSGSATTSEARQTMLARRIAVHAARIPPTLLYARSQNNNHLLSEAAGLYTAGVVLAGHPDANSWRSSGWSWFSRGLLMQVSPSGAYIQQSTNYHRMMLQLVIWMELMRINGGSKWDPDVKSRIQSTGEWLAALLDPTSGQVPNLGPNDGTYILPLTQAGFTDYRPVLQALWRIFWGQPLFPAGKWDDFSCWLGIKSQPAVSQFVWKPAGQDPLIVHHPEKDSWGYLRTADFIGRPGHADLLHVDLWWNGINIAQDAGTYRYNDPPPWDNTLTHTEIHNTLSCMNEEQMKRVGRFLYVDWAKSHSLPCQDTLFPGVRALHDGYKSYGWLHQRTLEAVPQGWRVIDQAIPAQVEVNMPPLEFRLHWLLPDCSYKIIRYPELSRLGIQLEAAWGQLLLDIQYKPQAGNSPLFALVRAGELLFGSGPIKPNWGWTSSTYNMKTPALSFSITVSAVPPLTFTTIWQLDSR